MILTGEQLVKANQIVPGSLTKIDNGVVPSFGPDPGGYTLTGETLWMYYHLAPGKSISFKTTEEVTITEGQIGLLFIKSTYARQGIILVTNSPVDAGYTGKLTIRLFNSSDEYVKLFGCGGFMQLVVSEANLTEVSYNGRWQGDK